MGRFLGEAVASVFAQRHENLESVIVDDASTEDTADWVRRLPSSVRYVRQDNRGPGAARNRGLDLAQHELLAFIDADDLWPANKLRQQLPVLDEHKCDFVVGLQSSFSLRSGAVEGARDYAYQEPCFIFLVGCGLYRRRVFERVGYFDETMRLSEDTDWFLRCQEAQASFVVVPEPTLFYRLHGDSLTHGLDAVGKVFFRGTQEIA
jgi:glycosyltransferase involved in cell wall biosynthesis